MGKNVRMNYVRHGKNTRAVSFKKRPKSGSVFHHDWHSPVIQKIGCYSVKIVKGWSKKSEKSFMDIPCNKMIIEEK